MALLVAALIVVPLIELWLIIQVGGLIGALPTIALLLACSLGGAWLVRREGRAAWRRVSTAVSAGKVPARETVDGALVVLGGALLLTPGFLTDACGLLLLTRPVRDLVRTIGVARLVGGGWRGVAFSAAGAAASRRPGRSSGEQPARQRWDVDGVAVEIDEDLPRTLPEVPRKPDGTP